MQISNRNKIRPFSDWFTVENKNTQLQVNFLDSYERGVRIEQ